MQKKKKWMSTFERKGCFQRCTRLTRLSRMTLTGRKCREVSSRMPRCGNLGKSLIDVALMFFCERRINRPEWFHAIQQHQKDSHHILQRHSHPHKPTGWRFPDLTGIFHGTQQRKKKKRNRMVWTGIKRAINFKISFKAKLVSHRAGLPTPWVLSELQRADPQSAHLKQDRRVKIPLDCEVPGSNCTLPFVSF